MLSIDFISVAPHLSIFKSRANKTNLGGVLFLIYIILLSFFAIIYFYDYFMKENYSYNYTLVKNNTKIYEQANEMIQRNDDFYFYLTKDDIYRGLNLSDNFLIIDVKKLEKKFKTRQDYDEEDDFTIINTSENSNEECIIKQYDKYSRNLDKFHIIVLYKCNGISETDCIIRDEDKIKYDSYKLHFGYRGYSYEHQNPENPLPLLEENNYFYQHIQFLENTNVIYLNWKLIEYEDTQSAFSKIYTYINNKKKSHLGGDIDSVETYTDDGHVRVMPSKGWKIKDEKGNHFIALLYLENHFLPDYDKYTRTEKSIVDVLSNICAISSTVFNLIGLAYRYLYSQNFDNYKIIENILTEKLRMNINHLKNAKKIAEPKIELKDNLTDSKSDFEDKEKIDINNNKSEEMEIKGSSKNLDLPSLNFLNFIIHTFYLKCFGPSRKQSLIRSCNNIVAKSITIENIVYNQMKLEYLWKDYKWNKPEYEIKQKDDLILNLKEK
jgi:hypothetical protein